MSKARIYGMPSKGQPNNRKDPRWKEKKPMDVFKQRSDMATPCKTCPTRYPGCRDTCRDQDFLLALDLQRKAKQDISRRKLQDCEQRSAEYRRDSFGRTRFNGR